MQQCVQNCVIENIVEESSNYCYCPFVAASASSSAAAVSSVAAASSSSASYYYYYSSAADSFSSATSSSSSSSYSSSITNIYPNTEKRLWVAPLRNTYSMKLKVI
jgi:hypothetical protein